MDQPLDLANQPKHKQSFLLLSTIIYKPRRDSIEESTIVLKRMKVQLKWHYDLTIHQPPEMRGGANLI
jgi:hypothetical protein